MDSSARQQPCGGCGADVGGVHSCPSCFVFMHPFCGTPVGKEGFAQPILCPRCVTPQKYDSVQSSSPIVASFSRACKAAIQDEEVPLIPSVEEPPPTSVLGKRKRSFQSVSTIQDRRKVVRWMVKEKDNDEIQHFFAATVDHFPDVFRAFSRNANIQKARNWWRERQQILSMDHGQTTVSATRVTGRMTLRVKAQSGRGRKRSEWVAWLYKLLLDEFDRLRKAGLKFDAPLLRHTAVRLLEQSDASALEESVEALCCALKRGRSSCAEKKLHLLKRQLRITLVK